MTRNLSTEFTWEELREFEAKYHFNGNQREALKRVMEDVDNFKCTLSNVSEYNQLKAFELFLMKSIVVGVER